MKQVRWEIKPSFSGIFT